MKKLFFRLVLCGAVIAISIVNVFSKNVPELIKVAEIKGAQLTGVTVSDKGRIFVNFPRWRNVIPFSVAEILEDGSFKAYPNGQWNFWMPHQAADKKFICVQSVVADGKYLWVLDPANPQFNGVVNNGAKLLQFDLETNELVRTIAFDSTIAPKNSYLNDLRIDNENNKIYITCSGLGAIVIVDIKTGKSRRVLTNHFSTKAENVVLEIDGKKLLYADSSSPKINSDGIAFDKEEGFLYYRALTGYSLYGIETEELFDAENEKELESEIEILGKTPAPDGMIMDNRGNLFMADLENNAIVYRNEDGEIETLIKDDRISWADTFSIGPDGFLYFTCSRIHQTELFNPGANVNEMTFQVYKIDISNVGDED